MEQPIPTAEILEKQIELAKIEQQNSPAALQMKLIAAEQQAKFALTPVGQELKRFETLQRMGQMYAMATIVPDTYKNNVPNCAIAVDMALRMNANPVMVMQNLYIVHGNPSWSSKFLIATINTCGRFKPLMYECNGLKGDDYGWRCYTYATDDRDEKDRLEGTWVTWKMVKAEGWDKKNGSKWNTMPEQMFRYRAAAFWQRMYAPEISMGFNTVEEQEDITDVTFEEVNPETRKNIRQMAFERAMAETENTAATSDEQPGQPASDAQPEVQSGQAPDPSIAAHKRAVEDFLQNGGRRKPSEDVDPLTGEVTDSESDNLSE